MDVRRPALMLAMAIGCTEDDSADWATSYGYAGGLSFTGLWTPPSEPPG